MDGSCMHDNIRLYLSPQFLKQATVKKPPSYISVCGKWQTGKNHLSS